MRRFLLAGWALRRAQRALAEGALELAREGLEEVVVARPRWLSARLWLATTLSEQGELELATAALEEARSANPGASVLRLWLGRILLDHERFEEAIEVLEEAEQLEPNNLHVPGYLSLARWAESGDEGALDELGWEIPPGGGEIWGRWLLELERRFPGGPGSDYSAPPEAPRSLLGRLSSWRAARLIRRAKEAMERRSFEQALSLADRAEMIWLGDEQAQELRVRAHFEATDERLDRLEEEPHDVDLRLDIAEGLLEIGDPKAALRALEPAPEHITSLDPNRLSWRAGEALLRGRALLGPEGGDPELAIEALSLAQELWPTEVEPAYYLAIALLLAGDRRGGRRALVSVCSLDSELAQIRLREYRAAVT